MRILLTRDHVRICFKYSVALCWLSQPCRQYQSLSPIALSGPFVYIMRKSMNRMPPSSISSAVMENLIYAWPFLLSNGLDVCVYVDCSYTIRQSSMAIESPINRGLRRKKVCIFHCDVWLPEGPEGQAWRTLKICKFASLTLAWLHAKLGQALWRWFLAFDPAVE